MLNTIRPLRPYKQEINRDLLIPEIRAIWGQIARSPHWGPFRKLRSSPSIQNLVATAIDLSQASVSAALPIDYDKEALSHACRYLTPWRVGPYQLGELVIDAEWRSERKWARIAPLLGDISGLRVADVGCSNGYFLFRLSALQPEIAIGFDPIDRCWLQFDLLQSIMQLPKICFVPTGLTSLNAFPEFFDLILCMGVIYHQREPLTAYRTLFKALRPGGRLILESLVINEPGDHVLVPKERYAKMRNAWNVPTPGALSRLAREVGFRHITTHSWGPITTDEQRRTPWAPYESLADFLDPIDQSKTVEGYPAPHSAAIVAIKS